MPSTFIVAGNRMNPASSIPSAPGPGVAPAIRATTSTTATSYVAVGEVVPFTTRVLNAGNTRLDAIAVTDPAASTAPVCDRSTLAPGVTTNCTYAHAVTPGRPRRRCAGVRTPKPVAPRRRFPWMTITATPTVA